MVASHDVPSVSALSDKMTHVKSDSLEVKAAYRKDVDLQYKTDQFNGSDMDTNLQNVRIFHLKDIDKIERNNFEQHDKKVCFQYGTKINIEYSKQLHTNCSCKPEWQGQYCSIPNVVAKSSAYKSFSGRLTLRTNPRRVIDSIAFNMEWELLEARVRGLYDVVDVFFILESNLTLFGERKPSRLLERLTQGYLKRYQGKILYVYLDTFPENGKLNGWIAESYQRNAVSKIGFRQLSGFQDDDIFIHFDADEILKPEVILFLKYHDNYPEPISFFMRFSKFGFFWKHPLPNQLSAACSVKFLKQVLDFQARDLRGKRFLDSDDMYSKQKYNEKIRQFVDDGGDFNAWIVGDRWNFAGWHCSWCLSPERIVIKMKSAINGDYPRWGDYPEKHNTIYITHLIKTGLWFDDVTNLGLLTSNSTDNSYAPKYMIDNWSIYQHLLDIGSL